MKTLNLLIPSSLIFITLFFGASLQGGEVFWFAFANFSSISLLIYLIHHNYNNDIKLPKSTLSNLIFIFSIWCLLTVFWSPLPHITFTTGLIILSVSIALCLYFLLTIKFIKWETLWITIIVFGIALALHGFYQLSIGIKEPSSIFANQNTFAAYLNLIILPTAGYFLISNKPINTSILGVFYFILVYSAALPGSRGATLGQILGIIFILFIARKHIPLNRTKILIAIHSIAFALATLATSKLLQFNQNRVQEAASGRLEIWQSAFNLLKDTPWYGNGVGTYWLLYPPYSHINDPSGGYNAHNDYLHFWIEGGLPALLLLIGIIIAVIFTWITIFKNKNHSSSIHIEATAITAGIAAIGIHSFFSFNLGVYSILFLLGILFGRIIDISQKTVTINTKNISSINKKHSTFFLVLAFFIVFIYNGSLLGSNYLLTKADHEVRNGNLQAATKSLNLAQTFSSNDNRLYLIEANIFQIVLSQKNTPHDIKQSLIRKILIAYDKAKSVNPYNPYIYYQQAIFLQEHIKIIPNTTLDDIKNLYIEALNRNPRLVPASIELIKLYYKNNNIEAAASESYKAIQYYHHPANAYMLKLFKLATLIFKESNAKQYETFLNEQLELKFEQMQRHDISNPKEIYSKTSPF